MVTYILRDHDGETVIDAEDLEAAREEAKDWAEANDYPDIGTTLCVSVQILDEAGNELDTVRGVIHPEESACILEVKKER